ncbi:hypothetical protein [Pedobacter alpinus]|uniref:Lipoprotein n=1 Tax=Pedobacter alpinus TaxID=1590643 RepID=A0ABW5TXF4_9SPHI
MNLGILILLSIACSQNKQEDSLKTAPTDTIIGSKNIKDEIAGSAYRNKAMGYFVIIGKDTSDFTCIFTESKSGKINIDLNIPYLRKTMTYRQRLKEIKLILPEASKSFNFDSLNYVSYGRLVQSGDLAIEITQEYKRKHGTFKNLFTNYNKFEEFLITSKLGRDLDNILKPYQISISSVSIEKLFFTTKKDLFWASKVEADSTEIPERILDCIILVKLKKENNNYP